MIKGCQKRIIHITNTGSPYFEEAYFILRRPERNIRATEDDMVREALRIAEGTSERTASGTKRNIKLRTAIMLSLSLISFVFGAIMLIIMLFA